MKPSWIAALLTLVLLCLSQHRAHAQDALAKPPDATPVTTLVPDLFVAPPASVLAPATTEPSPTQAPTQHIQKVITQVKPLLQVLMENLIGFAGSVLSAMIIILLNVVLKKWKLENLQKELTGIALVVLGAVEQKASASYKVTGERTPGQAKLEAAVQKAMENAKAAGLPEKTKQWWEDFLEHHLLDSEISEPKPTK